MAQHHHPVQLRTNIRKLLPGELDGSTNVSHCKIEFLDETKLPNLTPVENRVLRKAIIISHFSNNAFRQIYNDSFLVIKTKDNRNQPSSINCDIILTIFEGVSKPPQSTVDINIAHTLASTKNTPSEQGSGVFFTNDPPIQSPAFQQSRPPIGPKSKREWRCCESYIGLENCKTDEIPLQYLRQLIGQRNDSQINDFAAHAVDLAQSDACLRGTKVVSNVSLNVRPIHDASLVVLERPQTSVELEKEPWTLADFVRQHFQGTPGNLHTPEQISKLSCNLRGVKVKVSVGGVHYEESVFELKSGEASHVPLQLRHSAWLAKGDELEMPSLPCVNVGIPEKPILLPLELCRILPHQNLHDKVVSDQCFAVRGSMAIQQPTKPQGDILQIRGDQFKKACGNKLPKILFIEAGDCKSSSDGWVNLHSSLENFQVSSVTGNKKEYLSHRKVNEVGDALLDPEPRPLLSLRYNRNPNVEDRWARQLRDFISDHGDANTQTILIVHLQRSKSRAKMHNTIKMTCDIALGVQTFFISDNFLKMDKDTEKGAKEIRRNLRLRNPPLPNNKASEKTLAIHVSRFCEEVPTHGVEDIRHRPEQFVVTMVSRCIVDSAHCYQTESKLCTRAELSTHCLEDLFGRFASRVTSLDKMTVLRSGYLADTFYSEVASVESAKSSAKQEYNLESEFETILKTFGGEKRVLKAENVAYITLTEDRALELRDLGNSVATLLDKQSAHKSATAMVYTKDTNCVNSDPNSVRIQQVQKLKGRLGVGSSGVIKATFRHPAKSKFEATIKRAKIVRSQSDSGMIPRPISLEAPRDTFLRISSVQSQQISPSFSDPDSAIGDVEDQSSPKTTAYGLFDTQEEQKPMNGSIHSSAPLTSSISTKSSPTKSPESPPSNINSTHMKILEAAWKDDWLELYNTKWPVPTYLAQKAKERATMYLSVEDWGENTNSNQAPMPRLPKVHDRVSNTLYYL